ncbi:rho-related GTP-binding protein RhoU-like [Engraulis encrasicolus]|uniref:rho-related GTP-binding protein RhoU-like n=1 Tax=Engraulis encrasicolus TaxID=184585 RepID=UPI002FD606AE
MPSSYHSDKGDTTTLTLIVPPIPARRTSSPNCKETYVPNRSSRFAPEKKVTCVIVGDAAVGKTSLIVSYTTNGYPSEYVPTAFDNFAALVVVDGEPVRLQLCDISGERLSPSGEHNEEFAKLRSLCYGGADVFLLCYSVVQPSSLRSVVAKWGPEIRRHRPHAPILLVGTQADLRQDVQVLIQLAQQGPEEHPVSAEEASACGQQINAVAVTECSALTQKNVKEVFDAAIVASMEEQEGGGGAGGGGGGGGGGGQLDQRHYLRSTHNKIRKLSESWWKKFSCISETMTP